MAQAWIRAILVLRAFIRCTNRCLRATTSWGGSTIQWVIERSARMAENAMNGIVKKLIDALGTESVRFGDAIEPRYLGDWSGRSPVPPIAVVLPRSTGEVATLLRLCNEARQSVVPQGGMTGLAGGAIPSGGDICVSLERLVGIEEVDRAAATMTVLAGTTLQTVQDAAQEAGFEF